MEKEVEQKGFDKEREKKAKEEIRIPKYIGETSRSVFERSFEHELAFNGVSSRSFMVKHWVDSHLEEEEMDVNFFGVKVLQYTKSAFERQILESVIIEDERSKSNILNSKQEYNRCAIPRLATKLGDKLVGVSEEESRLDRKKEEKLEEEIRKLRKRTNTKRRKAEEERISDERATKRMRTERMFQVTSKPRTLAEQESVLLSEVISKDDDENTVLDMIEKIDETDDMTIVGSLMEVPDEDDEDCESNANDARKEVELDCDKTIGDDDYYTKVSVYSFCKSTKFMPAEQTLLPRRGRKGSSW